MNLFVDSIAEFSPCKRYRYWLCRIWDYERPQIGFLMLNPSTADELANDPTVRRCMDFAKRHGYGALAVCNVYGYRSTDPSCLWTVDDPIGPENDAAIDKLAYTSERVVAAWGVHARPERIASVLQLAPNLDCLGINKGGEPRHPLYVPACTPFIRYARCGRLLAEGQ